MDNKNSNKVTVNGGLSFTSILTIVFIVLKLCKVITWSWWWVFSPLLIQIGIGLLLIIIGLVIMAWASK